jgi:hydrogenase maturation protease
MTIVPSVLVLGVGNVMMQDDGVGVRALQALADAYELPAHVRLRDGGVAGLRLLPELEGVEQLLVIDAVVGVGPPGTIYRCAPEELPPDRGALLSAHAVGIRQLLSVVDLTGKRPQTRILGVQPLTVAVGPNLTPPLHDALPRVVAAAVEELQAMGVEMRANNHACADSTGADSPARVHPEQVHREQARLRLRMNNHA